MPIEKKTVLSFPNTLNNHHTDCPYSIVPSNVPFKCIYSPNVYNQLSVCMYLYKIHGYLSWMAYTFKWHWWNLPHWTSLMYCMCLLVWILSAPVTAWHCPRVHQCVCHQCWICSSVHATRWKFDCLTVWYFKLHVSFIILFQYWYFYMPIWKKKPAWSFLNTLNSHHTDCPYNIENFLKTIHNRHCIACPWQQDIWFLWVQDSQNH